MIPVRTRMLSSSCDRAYAGQANYKARRPRRGGHHEHRPRAAMRPVISPQASAAGSPSWPRPDVLCLTHNPRAAQPLEPMNRRLPASLLGCGSSGVTSRCALTTSPSHVVAGSRAARDRDRQDQGEGETYAHRQRARADRGLPDVGAAAEPTRALRGKGEADPPRPGHARPVPGHSGHQSGRRGHSCHQSAPPDLQGVSTARRATARTVRSANAADHHGFRASQRNARCPPAV